MGVISVRLNNEEEKIIKFLSEAFDEEKSALIKHSLKDMYEDFVDRKIIEDFDMKSKKKEPKYISSDEILKEIIG